MKHGTFLVVAALAAALLATGCNNLSRKERKAAEREQAIADSLAAVEQAQAEAKELEKKKKEVAVTASALPEEPVFDINTTLGTIRIKLYKQTPKHRDNFVKLALSGYYDGLLFHRVINGFMIQGGDPLTKDASKLEEYGTGGPDYTIPAEIEEGVKAGYHHKKGALAAARIGDAANPFRESSGSQFYIVQDEQACSALDGAYTVFGETISGLDVIDKIAAVKTDNRDIPLNPVRINSIKADPSQLKPVETEEKEGDVTEKDTKNGEKGKMVK